MGDLSNSQRERGSSALDEGPRFDLVTKLSPTAWQLVFLFAVDLVTNVIDFFFHAYLGRALLPHEFAIVQTANSVLLIIVTAFAVLQPVVARYVAESVAGKGSATPRAIFQGYFLQSLLMGIGLVSIALILSRFIAGFLNIPVTVTALLSLMVFIALTRPVVAGMLQGLQRFIAFGLTRTTFAFARLASALVFVGLLGGGAVAGVAAVPVGGILALGVGLVFLGSDVWQKSDRIASKMVVDGWRLSLAALLGYAALVGLQNNDLIWINRVSEAEAAGSYASLVVLRRVIAVLPGAVIVILYPRIVSRVTRGQLPDSLLAKAAGVVLVAGAGLSLVYFLLGETVVNLVFGPAYAETSDILGYMGLSMLGFGLGAIWLNLFLATKPWLFVILLVLILLGQTVLLATISASINAAVAIFGLSGWVSALGGLILYVAWLRPRLIEEQSAMEMAGGI